MLSEIIDFITDLRNTLVSVFPFLAERYKKISVDTFHVLNRDEISALSPLIDDVMREFTSIKKKERIAFVTFTFDGKGKRYSTWNIAFYDSLYNFVAGLSKRTELDIPLTLDNSICSIYDLSDPVSANINKHII